MNESIKPTTKVLRHVITFEDRADVEVVCMAQLGMSTRCIKDATGLSDNQITYRLHKAKVAEGYENRHTYRSEWRDGSGSAAVHVMRQLIPKLRRSAQQRLPTLFEHPTPKVSTFDANSRTVHSRMG